ncbi:MAG: hypothetical protein QOE64_1670 [Frankiales bacterium]|jgi:hypothetical protein|nr:hypothetical protein [Frankiales bacterium]
MRRSLIALLALPVLALAPLNANAAPKVVTVFTDAADDSGINAGTVIPQSSNLGLDLVKGTIARKGNNLEYTLKFAKAFPNYGQFPEGSRVMYQFTVGKGVEYRFTVKSFDIGKPDPVQQDGTDRIGKTYNGLFRLEKCGDPVNSATPVTFVGCYTVPNGYLTGKVDPAGSLTWTMPLSLLKLKTGSVINNGVGQFNASGCNICLIAHYAERSLAAETVIDDAIPNGTGKYVIPKA